ncbi:MAG: PadR family transcriptional regulator [Chloroflexaceae bacterium]|jgi:DNA-binding PadR family transcriptional regulator|nr:PadR family transcriptional regulator [Chloroflexaceae bacterium]
MEFILLGLLIGRERTLYDLNKLLDSSISLFYSASFGSISSALNRLFAKEWVSLREAVEHGRNKKIYAITPAGAAAFQEWLQSPIPSEKVKEPALTRLFFLGHLQLAQRIAVLEAHLAALEALAHTLDQLEQQQATLVAPAEQHDISTFQQLTLNYGREYYAFSLAWFQRLLHTLKEQQRDQHP